MVSGAMLFSGAIPVVLVLPWAVCWESLQITAALRACFLCFFLASDRDGNMPVSMTWPWFKTVQSSWPQLASDGYLSPFNHFISLW